MTEWHEGKARTLHDGEITVTRWERPNGRTNYTLEFPVTDGDIWAKAGRSEACAITDEDTAHRLARLINNHTGETNE